VTSPTVEISNIDMKPMCAEPQVGADHVNDPVGVDPTLSVGRVRPTYKCLPTTADAIITQ